MMDFDAEARELLDGLEICVYPNRLEFTIAALRAAYIAGAHAGLGQANRLIRGEEALPAELGLDP